MDDVLGIDLLVAYFIESEGNLLISFGLTSSAAGCDEVADGAGLLLSCLLSAAAVV